MSDKSKKNSLSRHFAAMKNLVKCRGVHPTCKLVLLDLMAYADSKGGIAYPSQSTIGLDLSYGVRQVKRAIAGLVAVGWIVIEFTNKEDAVNAGIPIKGELKRDQNGEPLLEVMNVYRVCWASSGCTQKTISKADEATLNDYMGGLHDKSQTADPGARAGTQTLYRHGTSCCAGTGGTGASQGEALSFSRERKGYARGRHRGGGSIPGFLG